jgi:hypothetical protein
MFEGYVDKDNIEFINKLTIYREDNTEYHVFFEGRIYNILSLIIMNLEYKKRDIRKTIFYLFEKYHFDFKLLNNDLNGDYSLVIVKEVNNKVKEIWMSTDHIANKILYFYTGGEDGTMIRFSTSEFEGSYIMPESHMSHLELNNDGVIQREINKDYDMTQPGKTYTEIENILTIARFALLCIIEKRIDYIKSIDKKVVILNKGSLHDKLLISITPEAEIVDVDSPVTQGIFMLSDNDVIYPFLDKTYMRLLKRISITEEELIKRLL